MELQVSMRLLLPAGYAAKRQTAGNKFTHRPKISIFALQGRLDAPIHVKFGVAEGHLGPLGPAKFHLSRCTGVGTWPPKVSFYYRQVYVH